ncbi:ABC transporter ATP-binding protein [Actinomadura roseirufa]|uniref:ABC transporter ATP-binding protein n=1 Tax=Actinomadura roseirufa TaxID=2094049 RepID=UPI0010410C77|nr:ABC transporter ATP-binding protein [Actinomadura roseirufa]
MPSQPSDQAATAMRTFGRLIPRFRPHRTLIVLSALLIMCMVALSMVSPLALRALIDDALPHRDDGLLAALCLFMIAAGVLTNLASLLQGRLTHLAGQRLVHDLRVDVFDAVQRMPLTFFTAESNSRTQSVLVSDIEEISDTVTFSAQVILFSLTGILTAGAGMLLLSWPLAVVTLALTIMLSLVNNRFARKRRRLTSARQDGVARMMRRVGEDLSLSGVIVGRTFGRQPVQRDRFAAESAAIADLTYRQRLAGRSVYAIIGIAFACVPPLIYWTAGSLFPGVSVGSVVVISLLQARLAGPIQELLDTAGMITSSTVTFDRVFAYIDMAEGRAAVPHRPPLSAGVAAGPPDLRLSGVGFTYPAADAAALREVSADFPGGSTTFVVGRSGSGKSTLAYVAAGLLAPTEGEVSAGHRVPGMSGLHSLVTLVPQEPAVFNTSVRENLLIALPDATDEALRAVLAAVELDTVVDGLAEGMDTSVGEHGHELSGGERQRLGLARAMLSPSPILILDEAASALDGVLSDSVYRSVRSHCVDRTLIVIAHRIPPLNDGDSVLLLTDGRVAEHGGHKELITESRTYRQLFAAQAAGP